MCVINGPSEGGTGKCATSPMQRRRQIGLSQSVLQRKLGGPVAPVCGPFFFMDFPRLLRLELRPVPAGDLHRVVLGQFVFVVGPLEEATLEDDRREIYQFSVITRTL